MTPQLHHRIADLKSALNLRLHLLNTTQLCDEKKAEVERHVAQLRVGLYSMLALEHGHRSGGSNPCEPPGRDV